MGGRRGREPQDTDTCDSKRSNRFNSVDPNTRRAPLTLPRGGGKGEGELLIVFVEVSGERPSSQG